MPADIRVRLSPEGLADVLAALKASQAAADALGKKSAEGAGVLAESLKQIKELLPALGLAAVIDGFFELGKRQLEAADAMGKLQQKVGSTSEELSGLAVAFKQNNVSQDEVQGALVSTAKRLDELRKGSEPTVEAFNRIGLSIKDFAGKDTAQSFELIATALSKVPDGAEKTALAQELLNKTSAELIPVLNELGDQGLQHFIDKAKETGSVINDDLVRAAQQAADAMTDLQLHVQGVGNSLVAGFAPQLAGAVDDLAKAFDGEGTDALQNFATFIGIVLRSVIALFTLSAKGLGTIGALVGNTIGSIADAVVDIVHGRGKAALDDLKNIVSQGGRILDEFDKDFNAQIESISTPKAAPETAKARNEAIKPPVDPAVKLLADARLAALKQSFESERELQKADLDAKAAAEKNAFDDGLESFKNYFAARRALLVAENNDEINSLKQQRAALAAAIVKPAVAGAVLTPQQQVQNIKTNSDIAKVDSDIRVKALQNAKALAELDHQEAQEKLALQKEEERAFDTIDELENNRHAVFQRNLDQEIEDLKKLGTQAGLSLPDINAQADRLTAARTKQFNLTETSNDASLALQDFNRQASAINDKVQAGILGQIAGEQQLADLQKAQLPQLQKNAAALLDAANATGQPEQIAKAKAFSDQVNSIANAYKGATDSALQFEAGGLDAFDKGVASLLTNIDQINSVGDAFKQLAVTIAKSLADIAAQLLAKQATLAIGRAIGLAAATGFRGGPVQALAGGDVVRGPELAISGPDKIPALLQRDEFVVRRQAAVQPGGVAFLRALNSGHISIAGLRRAGAVNFAGGGSVAPVSGQSVLPASPAGGSAPGVRVVNVLHPDFVSEGLATTKSEKAILNIISRNPSTINRALSR